MELFCILLLLFFTEPSFESVDKISSCNLQIKASERCIPVVFITQYKVVLKFEFMDEILRFAIQKKVFNLVSIFLELKS